MTGAPLLYIRELVDFLHVYVGMVGTSLFFACQLFASMIMYINK